MYHATLAVLWVYVYDRLAATLKPEKKIFKATYWPEIVKTAAKLEKGLEERKKKERKKERKQRKVKKEENDEAKSGLSHFQARCNFFTS